uniref:Uncharacterized protein n=1 Tax=Triticum urartu TaxID=4572 RepID=A0A8R7VAI9_TRIUA
MQVGQSSSNSDGYLISGAPVEDCTIALEQMGIKRTIAHVFIYKQPLITMTTETNQFDQVDVLDQSKCTYLCPELLLSLTRTFKPFHCYTSQVT